MKIITGDQVLIAQEMCRELGLGDNVLDATIVRHTPASRMGELAQPQRLFTPGVAVPVPRPLRPRTQT